MQGIAEHADNQGTITDETRATYPMKLAACGDARRADQFLKMESLLDEPPLRLEEAINHGIRRQHVRDGESTG